MKARVVQEFFPPRTGGNRLHKGMEKLKVTRFGSSGPYEKTRTHFFFAYYEHRRRFVGLDDLTAEYWCLVGQKTDQS
jgi:hypothetical protein